MSRNVIHLFLAIIGLSGLGWFINSYPPEAFWQYAGFFLLLGLTTFFLFQFILNNLRQAVLVSIGVVVFFVLRAFNLRFILYPILLMGCLVSIEYSFMRRKRVK